MFPYACMGNSSLSFVKVAFHAHGYINYITPIGITSTVNRIATRINQGKPLKSKVIFVLNSEQQVRKPKFKFRRVEQADKTGSVNLDE